MKRAEDALAALDARSELDERIEAVAASSEPYWAAIAVMNCASRYLLTSVIGSRLYQIWGALTDGYELESRRDPLAEMKRAADEWLVAGKHPVALDAYLDKWQYDILGYGRPAR